MTNTTVRRPAHKRKSNTSAPFIVIVLMTILASALLALLWQIKSPRALAAANLNVDPVLLERSITVNTQEGGVMPVEPPPPITLPDPAQEGLPAGQTRVGNSYFDDAAFVGDSITTGISLYDVMSNADVFAETGISPGAIQYKECIKRGDQKITIMQALKESNPKKIFVMLGGNALGGNSDDGVFTDYATLVDDLIAQHPDSLLYIQSVLPLNESIFKVRYAGRNLTNTGIESFNQRLQQLCTEKNLIYLDVASAFKDETGGMPAAYTPDGVHLNSAQYEIWFDYLRTHTKQ